MTRILFRGGYVHTPADPHATALIVDGDTIVWTGDDDAAAHFLDGLDRIIELDGRLVTPAFVDAHAHLAMTGLVRLGADLADATGPEDLLERVRAHAAGSTLGVVLGHGWDESRWDGGSVDRAALDEAVSGRPAYLSRVDAHSAYVSSALVEEARRATGEDPEHLDGWDAHGAVSRAAHHAVRDAQRALLSREDRRSAIRTALELAASRGIGLVHDLGAPHINDPDDLDLVAELRAEHTLPEVVGYWGSLDLDEAVRRGLAGAAGDLCVDGALGSRTAALLEPYADAPGSSGHLYLTAEEVAGHVVACTAAGLQAGFHVIGDRATAELVSGFQQAADELGAARVVQGRHRVEHLEMASPEQLRILGELGVTASVQPVFDAWWGGPDGLYESRLGKRAHGMNAFASMNRAGVALAFGSDSPVTPFAPWAAVRAAAWHHHEDERITVRAAFNAHTRGGWRAARRDEGGVIALGAPAYLAVWDVPGDLVVQTPDPRVAAWSTDPRAGVPQLPGVHPDHPLPTCVLTLVSGEVAYDPGGLLS